MKIRIKNIPMFQNGGVPQWYLDRYGNRTSLLGWDLNKRYNYSNLNLNANDHRNAGSLDTVYRKNLFYTQNPGVISLDIQNFYNTDGNRMSAEDFVNFYNSNAAKIRGHWALDLTYNARTAGEHNRLFRKMFSSRSNLSQSPGSDYNIGYLDNLEDIEGSSTWLRRMDLYENEFDINNPDKERLHEITLSDGKKAVVYKKANGDIALYNPLVNQNPNNPVSQQNKPTGSIDVGHREGGYGFDWNKISLGMSRMLPDLLEGLRLAGSLHNNNKIYDAKLKGIRPDLVLTYLTHRQVVGDEATKLAYYRRASQGLTKAALPFTSDADRQMAYQFEAKRVGDELRALGDLADNQEIRRTSDESNQHQWDNTRRRTEVANQNIAQINAAHAAKLDLIALKYAANWSSWDNFLKSKEYRARQLQAEEKSLEDQIWSLNQENTLSNDKKLIELRKAAYDAYDNDTLSEQEKLLKILEFNNYKRKLLILMLRENYNRRKSGLLFGKSGVKITRKRKEDLLYKSTRDVVEHFRKMSKMSDDSTQRSRNKSYFKLATHPGYGSTRKMQLGGVAPFTVFTPVALGGETSTLVSSSSDGTRSSSSKSDSGKETLDLIKNLFKEVNGLPVDVNTIYKSMSKFLAKAKAFGEDLDTNDIASIYLLSMQQLSNVKHSKEVFDKAKAFATLNEALNEFAVTAGGNYIVLDKDGNLSEVSSLNDLKNSEKVPVTNLQLLYLREYSPNMSFAKGDYYIENIINNGMGVNKIGAQIKALAGNIGSSESKLDGISLVESNKVKLGLQILANAPDGYYKTTTEDKNLNALVQAALTYIENMLSPSLKAILDSHGGTKQLIATFLSSQSDVTHNVSISPLTGRAAKDANGNSKGSENSENSAGLAFALGQGPRELIDFNTGTSNAVRVLGIKGVLLTHSKENLGQGSTLLDATKSQLGGYLQWNKATFGGSRLNSLAFSHIILNDSTIIGMDLPFTTDINGNEIPDFLMLRKLELADLEISLKNVELPNEINMIYLKYGLPAKFDLNGNLNIMNYKRFAAIQATLDESSLLNKDAILSDEVTIAGEIERDLYVEAMKKSNKDYDLSSGMWITGWGKDLLYKGTIFIPYSEDIAFAALSSGQPFKQNLPNNTATIQQMLYAPKASLYKTPDVTLSQIKNN